MHISLTAARRLFAASIFAALGACASGGSQGPVVADRPTPIIDDQSVGDLGEFEERRSYDRKGFVRPLHMDGQEPVRVGILLPFTAESPQAQQAAEAMFNAAQLAAFDAGDEQFLLLPKDTKGTAEGATAAARAALADGAEIILGPLYGRSVAATAKVARAAGKPVIAFSSDVSLAQDGVFLLSYPPEQEIARITDYAIANGLDRFGLIAPTNRYGERVTNAFSEEVATRGGTLVHSERYRQDVDAMREPAKRLAQYSKEVVPAELRHDYDPSKAFTGDDTGYVRGYQAVLVPEQGTLLRALAPLFPYYNVNIEEVKLLGVSSWNNPRLMREPALRGGWFAGPDPAFTEVFDERYSAAFGAAPPRLASLSYDATLLAARLSKNPRERDRFSVRAIANPNGFLGADGLFRLRADGAVERGLAILEIQPGGINVIDPAPRSFAPLAGGVSY